MIINLGHLWRSLSRDVLLCFGVLVLFLVVTCVILLPYFYTVPFDRIDLTQANLLPSWDHLFGTNDLGQDQLARILVGGRISLTVAIASVIVAMVVGTLVGAIAGFYGGVVDLLLMRVVDLFLSLPQLPLLLLTVYLFRDKLRAIAGPNLGIFILVVIVIGGLNWMTVARLVRADFLKLKEREFIQGAIAMGADSNQRLKLLIGKNRYFKDIID